MALLSELFVSSQADATRYDEQPEWFAPYQAPFRGLTALEFADLWAAMCHREPAPEDVESFTTLLNVGGGSRLISAFPDDLVKRLSALTPDNYILVAEKWVQLGELAYLECEPQDAVPILEELHRQASVAIPKIQLRTTITSRRAV